MDRSPTLFALASGFGRAAVAVVRISGPASDRVLSELSGPLPAPRRLVLRTLRDPRTGEALDQALVVWMPGPGTFTGEDMAELHLHGGPAVRAAVLRALSSIPGCVPAGPGAFTRRAFLNGRLGLTEAEGIADLIEAETEAQRRQALRQLDGALGRQVADWRDRLIDLLAGVEAALDFSDEGDVDDDALDAALFAKARVLRDAIGATLDDGKRGERLRDGYTVVLAGPPNAGKSTLLNALSQREAAIVSPIPGTTRDVIEVRCDLGSLPVLLIDTAGLREASDAIEAEGIRRTRARIAQADLVLLLDEDGTEGDPAGLFSESTQTAFTTGGSPLLEGARRSHKASRVSGRFLTPRHPGAAQRNPGSRTIGFSRLYTVGGSGFRIRLRRPGMTMWSLRDRPAWKEREPVATDATSPVPATIPLPMDLETGRIGKPTGHPDSGAVVLRVRTKSDRSPTPIPSDTLAISAMTGAGLDTLLDAIERHAANAIGGEAALITRERHRDGLTRCRDHLDRLLRGTILPELAAEDLRLAVRALGEVGGHVGVEEMLDRLFSGFCIGK